MYICIQTHVYITYICRCVYVCVYTHTHTRTYSTPPSPPSTHTNTLLQVHGGGLRTVRSDKRISQFTPPGKAVITKVAVNPSQVVLVRLQVVLGRLQIVLGRSQSIRAR
jgi:hypothetical protein